MSNILNTETTDLPSLFLGTVFSVGVAKIVGDVATACLPPNASRYSKVMTRVGTYAIAGMVNQHTHDFAKTQVDTYRSVQSILRATFDEAQKNNG